MECDYLNKFWQDLINWFIMRDIHVKDEASEIDNWKFLDFEKGKQIFIYSIISWYFWQMNKTAYLLLLK